MISPIVKETAYTDPLSVFGAFAHSEGAILLDSGQGYANLGRYSFIAYDPFLKLTSKNQLITLNQQQLTGNPFTILATELKRFQLNPIVGLPPFQGGMAGFFSYDLCHHLEKLPYPKQDIMDFPDMAVGFYDLIIAFDHELKKAWIISSGYPAMEEKARVTRAHSRVAEIEEMLVYQQQQSQKSSVDKITKIELSANFDEQSYQEIVQQTIDYIYAGDIFQANISQCFSADLPKDFPTLSLYKKLRELNPAPFAGYLKLAETILISASPERFIKVDKGMVESRPIKGTRKRSDNREQDLQLADELKLSSKDRAENTMIVDLLRNDLSKVCECHSVRVTKLCEIESFATVHHLVSVIEGKLKENYSAVDLLQATFPGGSITGAPKIRAMEIIAELEPSQRGIYCGCLGYIDFSGNMDSAITIRTFAIKNNKLTFQTGGGIVADSNPGCEYQETLIKAAALQRALLEMELS